MRRMRMTRPGATPVAVMIVALGFVAARGGPFDPPAGYYDSATGTGAALKSQLHDIIDDHTVFSYNDLRSILQVTDADPDNPGHVLLIYDRVSLDVSVIDPGGAIPGWDGGISWNREHTWPSSRGLGSSGPDYTDLHHLRPADPSVNSSRGNKNFGGAYGQQAYGAVNDGGSFWYPGDADAGMVARHELYMATRYDGVDSSTTDLELQVGDTAAENGLGNIDRLLEWHYQAVPGDFERGRNQIIYDNYQGNRNPYIDRPEFVWSVYVDQTNDSRLFVGSTPAADGSSTTSVDLGRVLIGAALPAAQSVTLHRSGTDGTYYEVTASGDATSSITGRYNAFPINTSGTDSTTLTVGLSASTATAGSKTGSVLIDNLDVTTAGGPGLGGNDADDEITVSLAVLDHAIPSFAVDATTTSLTLNFGTVTQGASPSLPFEIFNLAGSIGTTWTAGLDLDSIFETDPADVFTTSLTSFSDLDSGSSTSSSLSMRTDTTGSFSGSYLLGFSDEDLDGATTHSMTLSVSGTVVPVPEPALLAAAGAAWIAGRWRLSRRRRRGEAGGLRVAAAGPGR
jgi:endonuclease I